ncbi:MAG TPA: flavin reductase family protein [Beutenbergiaceae bacterium]|nr:flavin reductase family protein [Beutenbergiaceae bacterium]
MNRSSTAAAPPRGHVNPQAPGSANHAPTADSFKDIFSTHPAGVALVTATDESGPVGLTVSSVASVSPDPAALSFSLTSARGSAAGILHAGTFVVHLLNEKHSGLAATFARSGAARFTPEQGWSGLPSGEPFLPSARWALRCAPIQTVSVGPSELMIAEVLQMYQGPPGQPLVYYEREFRTLT